MKYKFKGRAGGRYYWSAPAPGFGPAYEEQVSCDVLWFWGQRVTGNTGMYPPCTGDCHSGWGATGRLPLDHVVVTNPLTRSTWVSKRC